MQEASRTSIEALLRQHRALLETLLQGLADHPELADEEERLKGLISKVSRNARRQRRAATQAQVRSEDEARLATCKLFQLNDEHSATHRLPSPDDGHPRVLHQSRNCYICKAPYKELHTFYHQLCPACADENHTWRTAEADMRGRIALVTGGRIKIGFETALKLLRWGARVIVTTRFPASGESVTVSTCNRQIH